MAIRSIVQPLKRNMSPEWGSIICRAHATWAARGDDYIVMDYIESDTLADLIRRDDTRLKSYQFVKTLLAELIDVVGYLHNRRVVHCDIKPDNINHIDSPGKASDTYRS